MLDLSEELTVIQMAKALAQISDLRSPLTRLHAYAKAEIRGVTRALDRRAVKYALIKRERVDKPATCAI